MRVPTLIRHHGRAASCTSSSVGRPPFLAVTIALNPRSSPIRRRRACRRSRASAAAATARCASWLDVHPVPTNDHSPTTSVASSTRGTSSAGVTRRWGDAPWPAGTAGAPSASGSESWSIAATSTRSGLGMPSMWSHRPKSRYGFLTGSPGGYSSAAPPASRSTVRRTGPVCAVERPWPPGSRSPRTSSRTWRSTRHGFRVQRTCQLALCLALLLLHPI